MSNHLSKFQISEYLEGKFHPSALLEADDHISACEECSEILRDHATAGSMLVKGYSSDHLTFALLESLADENAAEADRHIANSHLRVCVSCADQLRDLINLRLDLAPELPTLESSPSPAERPTFRSSLRSIIWGRVLIPAFGILMIAALAAGVWYLKQPQAELSTVQPPRIYDPVLAPSVETRPMSANAAPNSLAVTPAAIIIDGARTIAVGSDGQVSGLNTSKFDDRIRRALVHKNINVSTEGRSLAQLSGTLMGAGDAGVPFALLSPVGKVLASPRPQFRWSPVKEAKFYTVEVFDENFNIVRESGPINTTNWNPTTPLKRGRTYVWQVTANIEGEKEIRSPVRPAPDAKFKIITTTRAREITQAKRTGSNLVVGLVYADAGMLVEAEKAFSALVRANPNSDAARALLAEVRAVR